MEFMESSYLAEFKENLIEGTSILMNTIPLTVYEINVIKNHLKITDINNVRLLDGNFMYDPDHTCYNNDLLRILTYIDEYYTFIEENRSTENMSEIISDNWEDRTYESEITIENYLSNAIDFKSERFPKTFQPNACIRLISFKDLNNNEYNIIEVRKAADPSLKNDNDFYAYGLTIDTLDTIYANFSNIPLVYRNEENDPKIKFKLLMERFKKVKKNADELLKDLKDMEEAIKKMEDQEGGDK